METPALEQPTPGQKTEQQPSRMLGGSVFSAIGSIGDGSSPIGSITGIWPGWGSMLWGTYGTYRAMLRHDTIAFAVSQVLGPLLGSEWNVDADEDAPPEAVQWVKDNIIRHRNCIMPHALRAVLFGNAPFEVVWNVSGGFVIERFVPLLQDVTQVLRNDQGKREFTGLQNQQAKLAPAECLYIINRSDAISGEPGDDYGRSRLENIRDTAWVGWLDTARRLAELEDRVSGVIPIIIVPAGTAPDGKTFAAHAATLLPSLNHPRSQGAVLETPALGEVDAATDPARLKQLSTTVNTLDMGQRATSQAQMIAKLEYWDRKIGRGLYRGERTLFATDGASRADSQQHTANAEPDEEAIDNMIAEHINAGPVRTGLTLNFGEEILKKVRGIKPSPLVDEERISANAKIDAMLQNQKTAEAVLNFIDGDKLFGLAGVPITGKWADVLAKAAEAQKAMANAKAQQMQPVNGDAKVNGNGVNKRTLRAVNRLVGKN